MALRPSSRTPSQSKLYTEDQIHAGDVLFNIHDSDQGTSLLTGNPDLKAGDSREGPSFGHSI